MAAACVGLSKNACETFGAVSVTVATGCGLFGRFREKGLGTTRSFGSANGVGVFYWEPEAWPGWNGGYTLGALNESGQFTSALDPY